MAVSGIGRRIDRGAALVAARVAGRIAFALAALLTALLLAQYIHAMATTSLWNDEFYSVAYFSQQGAFATWTDYHVPNNHILFNLINSAWPASIAHEPLPSRLASFIAVGAAFALLAAYSIREHAWGGGAVALLLLGTNVLLLDVALQARGYGFTVLAGMLQLIATARYLDDGGRGWLVAAAAAGFVGIASIPVYFLFGFPLAAGLLVLRPRREVVVALVATAILVAAFHAPTVSQIIAASRSYEDEWGAEYATLGAVYRTLLYGVPPGALAVAYLGLSALVVLLGLVRGDRTLRGFIVICLAALAIFFAACLAMTTPLVRTTVYGALVPVVLLVAISGTRIAMPVKARLAGNVLLLAAAVPLAVIGIQRLGDFRFVPIEAWLEAARVAEAIAPPGTPIHATFRREQLAAYVDAPGRVVEAFDADAYRAGRLVVADGNFWAATRFKPADYTTRAVTIDVPQRRGERQSVSVVPQGRGSLAVTVEGARSGTLARITDGDPRTAWKVRPKADGQRIRLGITPEGACPRLLVAGAPGALPAGVAVLIESGGRLAPAAPADVPRVGDLMIVALGETPPERIVLDMGRDIGEGQVALRDIACID